ncbi:uncharacterized protein LOC126980986 [Eriocheir sinensis]|uniref:uncharacterized protein LOC126980986 n=1 Tax=Eriocheir sinensis TaxID=95602 RepID=UPI0021CACD4E|nr:uncharacterized protein LOC126980986 [Eriocheir sinensis]
MFEKKNLGLTPRPRPSLLLRDIRHEQELELQQVAWRFMKRREKEQRAKEERERRRAERSRARAEKKTLKALMKSGAVSKGSTAQMAEEGEAGDVFLGPHGDLG